MSLKLAKNNAPAYDYYSEGDGSDPVSALATVNQGGGTVSSNVITAYLVATTYLYQSISVAPQSEQAGVNWQVSLNGITWAESVTPADLDARGGDQVLPIYFRSEIDSDGSVATGQYVACKIAVAGVEIV